MAKLNIIYIQIMFLLILPLGLAGQVKIEEYNKVNTFLPGEKVYLHLDRPNYMQGDTIWFKAYSWFGYEQLPDTVSKVLYVDLLNPKDSVELKRKLLIQNGTSVGEFSLDKNIPPGKYTVRAYTRWMQNDNTGEPFYQAVTIGATNQNFQVDCSPLVIKQADGDSLKVSIRFYELDQSGDLKNDFSHKVNYTVQIGDNKLDKGEVLTANAKEQLFKCRLPQIGEKDSVAILKLSIKDEHLTFEKQFRIPLKEELDFQFFPEGGKMVNGLESKVAFKAIGTDGLSREVKGVIKDGAGEVVTSFQSTHKGMGAFMVKPDIKKEYTAFVEYNHREFKFPLPKSDEEGSILSVSYMGNDSIPVASIKYSPSKANFRKYFVGSAYGKIWFTAPLKTTEDSCLVKIPLELLPEGVSRLTILDSDFKPESERLFYVDKNQRFKIEVKADSLSYGTRSKVTLQIKTTGNDSSAVLTNLSLAVVDKEQIIKGGGNGGISGYKLLESELKGNIEDVGWYFKNDSSSYRDALDLLILTQGYRRFSGGNTNISELKYIPERSFDVMGKLALSGNNQKDKNFNYSGLGLTLLCPSDKSYYDQTSADSLGRFEFHMPLQFGNPLALVRAFTSTGKLTRQKIPKEKSFRGDIFIDELLPAPIFTPPPPSSGITSPAIDYIRQLQESRKTEISKITNGIKWHLNLPEVTIKAKSRDRDWYTHYEDEAKKIVDMDSLDPTGKKYGNVYDLLVREFGAREYRLPGVKTIKLPSSGSTDWYFPIYLLNGNIYFNAGEDQSSEGIRRQMDPDSGYAGNPNGELGESPGETYSARFISLLKDLSVLQINEIKKIMVLPWGNISFHYASPDVLMPPVWIEQSMVVLETYSKKNFYRGNPEGIKTFIIEGLDSPRLFYSPRYDASSKQNPIYDGRATLYWNPSVRTDQNGQAKVEFYTGDRRAEMEVIVNGITLGSGITGQGNAMINVMVNK